MGPSQIFGGPDWLDSGRFEINAKAEQPVGDHLLLTMLQTLLAERFKLVLHRETKPVQVYVLGVGKNGPKLEKGDGTGAKTGNGRGDIVATNATMDRFAEILSRERPARRTGGRRRDRGPVDLHCDPGATRITIACAESAD